jgi:hypothetical protein
MENAPDTESGFLDRAKQPIAGTAKSGGQRQGHPKVVRFALVAAATVAAHSKLFTTGNCNEPFLLFPGRIAL